GRQRVVLDHRPWGAYARDVAFDPQDGARLATAGSDGKARLWTIDPTGRTPPEATVVGRLVSLATCVAFRPPFGRELAAGDEDGSARVWDVETGEEVLAISGLGEGVFDIAFSPDGTLLATADESGFKEPGSVTVWDMEAGRVRFRLRQSDQVHEVAFSPDGTRLATACADRTV